MRKISAYYYLNYPDKMPVDPSCASSEVYVEVGAEDADISSFDCTYAVNVCTVKHLEKRLQSERFFLQEKTLIVAEFTDRLIEEALNSILDDIDNHARKVS